MTKLWAIIFALLAGGSTALEAFINGELGKSTTALVATFISLTVGAIFFLASIIVTGDLKCLVSINGFNYKLLLGGVFGGLIIYFYSKGNSKFRSIKYTYINSCIPSFSWIFY